MKYLIISIVFMFAMVAYGFYDDVVIKDALTGSELTKCSGVSCEPTTSGILNGFSYGDSYNGLSVMPAINHIDGTKTECLGMFCERKSSDSLW